MVRPLLVAGAFGASVDKLREIDQRRLAALRRCGHGLRAGSVEHFVPYGGPHLQVVDRLPFIRVFDLLELVIRDLVAERERQRTVCYPAKRTEEGFAGNILCQPFVPAGQPPDIEEHIPKIVPVYLFKVRHPLASLSCSLIRLRKAKNLTSKKEKAKIYC